MLIKSEIRRETLFMDLNKSIYTSRKLPKLISKGIVGKSTELNERIERNILINEKRIAIGTQRAQEMQTK